MTDRAALETELTALVPLGTAERLASVLTEDDVGTLRTLVRKATPENTVRALASDLGYLEAWHRVAHAWQDAKAGEGGAWSGAPLPWPASDDLALRFVAHHLFLAEERAKDASHGMPAAVEAQLREAGVLRGALPHAPSTVARRLSSWRKLHVARGYDDALTSRALRTALTAATKAQDRPPERKSKKAVTRQVLDRLIGTDEPNADLDRRTVRDTALLLVAFASGGRRRSELGRLLIERIERTERREGRGSDATEVRSARILLGRTKATEAQAGASIIVTGRALRWLDAWLEQLAEADPEGAAAGPIFRPIDRWGRVARRGLTGDAVADVLKARCEAAGLDPTDYSAHGLRSGFLTEASLRGVPIEAAMRHSLHASVQSAQRYFDDQSLEAGRGARLAD